jgi:hypothetical protein
MKSGLVLLIVALSIVAGCGPQPIVGGTSGQFCVNGEFMGDVELSLYPADSPETRAGFAVTTDDGWFQLVQEGASGRLLLPAGRFRVTVASAGTEWPIPADYTKPDTTPLEVEWGGGIGSLNIDLAVNTTDN